MDRLSKATIGDCRWSGSAEGNSARGGDDERDPSQNRYWPGPVSSESTPVESGEEAGLYSVPARKVHRVTLISGGRPYTIGLWRESEESWHLIEVEVHGVGIGADLNVSAQSSLRILQEGEIIAKRMLADVEPLAGPGLIASRWSRHRPVPSAVRSRPDIG